MELRILAHVAGEDVLKQIFERGEDVHAATAAEVLKLAPDEIGPGERSRAKAVNFGIVYGLSAHGLSEQLDIPHEEAAEYIERYLGRFPAVRKFIERTIVEATDRGYVTTLFGRRRDIPELRSRQYQTRSLGERLAVNTIIQGTAADIIKIAMVRCDAALRAAGLATRLVLTIHDELLFEGPRGGGGAGDRAGQAGDGGGLRARPAAGRRHRRGRELDGGEVVDQDASPPRRDSRRRRADRAAGADQLRARKGDGHDAAAVISFIVGTLAADRDRRRSGRDRQLVKAAECAGTT